MFFLTHVNQSYDKIDKSKYFRFMVTLFKSLKDKFGENPARTRHCDALYPFDHYLMQVKWEGMTNGFLLSQETCHKI